MELSNTFVVDASVERTWTVLTDLGRVAPCLPGAALTGVDGDDVHGRVTIKVGPVTARYEGTARFAERDDAGHTAVIRAEAREARGQGGASATISAALTEHGRGTRVALLTDLELSGRVAQFGRGVIADVSGKLIGQFADRLEREIAQEPGRTEPAAPAAPPPPTTTADDADAGLDVLTLAGPVLRRAAPTLGAAALGLVTGLLLGRRGCSRATGTPITIHLILHGPAHEEATL